MRGRISKVPEQKTVPRVYRFFRVGDMRYEHRYVETEKGIACYWERISK